ncbi:MAG: hypothetical protein ACFCVD_22885 [Nodosilinea sp.]
MTLTPEKEIPGPWDAGSSFLGLPKVWLGGACAVVSLIGHGILLGLPLPAPEPASLSPAPPAEQAPASLTVSVLPIPADVDSPSSPSAPEPAVEVPAAPVPQSAAAPPPPLAPPPQAVEPAAPATAPISQVEAPSPVQEPVVPPPPPAVEPDPYADFPHLVGAETCGDQANCWRTPTSNWRTETRSLTSRLEAQGYALTDVTTTVLGTDTGVNVYTVAKAGTTEYYLNMVSVGDGVLYTMTPQPITLDELSALQQI